MARSCGSMATRVVQSVTAPRANSFVNLCQGIAARTHVHQRVKCPTHLKDEVEVRIQPRSIVICEQSSAPHQDSRPSTASMCPGAMPGGRYHP